MIIQSPRLLLEWTGIDLPVGLPRDLGLREARPQEGEARFSAYFGDFDDADNRNLERLRKLTRHDVNDLSNFAQTPRWQDVLCELGKRQPRLLIYAGSGLSYEAGIPPLKRVHEIFGVECGEDFCVEPRQDSLLSFLATDSFAGLVSRVESFHTLCWTASPSKSHLAIAGAYGSGRVTAILTDNIDFIFERRLHISPVRTRGDGLTSEQFDLPDSILRQIDTGDHVLLVVGISADRRQIISSLAARIPTVVINPGKEVSPHSKNLDYLADLKFKATGLSDCGHVFVKRDASDCLAEVLACLGVGINVPRCCEISL